MRLILFAITNKKTTEMKSTNLLASQVHYLFIDKKWDKNNCVIHEKHGSKMNYETFCKRYPLQ
jgi:hypothetical protein